jgi:hypothetical protein
MFIPNILGFRKRFSGVGWGNKNIHFSLGDSWVDVKAELKI